MNEAGRSVEDVLRAIDERRQPEPDVHGARLFGLVYPSGDHEIEALSQAVSERYLFGNALNPFRFPSLADIATSPALVEIGDVRRRSPRSAGEVATVGRRPG